jgi:hypothetical protein
MAKRPIFLPMHDGKRLVRELYVEFQWNPGMAVSQKQKNVRAIHEAAKKRFGVNAPLEVSSKSQSELGRALSSFNLLITTNRGQSLSVETAFQGSKVFTRGGPFTDLFGTESMAAKRDSRLRESGPLTHFEFFGKRWELQPKTAFYDWIYINALQQNGNLAAQVTDYDCFTDIEFNPERSINCQARSVALFCALYHTDKLAFALRSPEEFRQFYRGRISEPGPTPENSLLL